MSEEKKTPMSEEMYKNAKEAFRIAYERRLEELNLEFFLSNNPYKEGNIIEDHMGKGMWNGKYKIYRGLKILPEFVYYCRVCKKDGTPTKKEEYRWIYSSNILIKN